MKDRAHDRRDAEDRAENPLRPVSQGGRIFATDNPQMGLHRRHQNALLRFGAMGHCDIKGLVYVENDSAGRRFGGGASSHGC